MGNRLLWCYCDKCGKRIEVGDTCFDVSSVTYCSDCCKEINTLYEWKKRAEAEDDGGY